MPERAAKICNHPGCNNLCYGNNSYCPIHKSLHINDRETSNKNYNDNYRTDVDRMYYSAKWRKLRNWYIANHPLCEQCQSEDRITPATEVHHIIESKDNDAALFYNSDNLMALCHQCHMIITRQNKLKRNKDIVD